MEIFLHGDTPAWGRHFWMAFCGNTEWCLKFWDRIPLHGDGLENGLYHMAAGILLPQGTI
jgi:hypothetical protein